MVVGDVGGVLLSFSLVLRADAVRCLLLQFVSLPWVLLFADGDCLLLLLLLLLLLSTLLLWMSIVLLLFVACC